MDVYKIEKSEDGWTLFRKGSVRPLVQAETRDEIIQRALEKLSGCDACIRIINANGTFEELRVQKRVSPGQE